MNESWLDAVQTDNLSVVKDYGKKNSNKNINDLDERWGAIHVAVINENISILKYLLKEKADIELKDEFKFSPLRLAVDRSYGLTKTIKFLCENGAKITKEIINAGYDDKTINYLTKYNNEKVGKYADLLR